MSIPGLALFYCGMVLEEEHSFHHGADVALRVRRLAPGGWQSVTAWPFPSDATLIGTLYCAFFRNIGADTTSPLASTIPELLFAAYQMTFAVITVALVAGSVVD